MNLAGLDFVTVSAASISGPLLGGICIGIAAAALLFFNGRIAGISSIAGKLFFALKSDRLWRVLFLLGLIAGAKIVYTLFSSAPVPREHFPVWLLGLAGLLVGYGSSLGSGCTSGHGVCGLGRLSWRSLVATLVFLLAGIVTAIVVRHVFGVI